jgi:putative transposase
MKPYSIDLRQKIVDTYVEGKTSQRQLAKQFRVALSFIENLLKYYRATGSVAPKKRRVQTPTQLNAEQLATFAQLVVDNNDATLAELRVLLYERTGVSIGTTTVDRMLKKLNLTVKKKHFTQQQKRLNGCKVYE